MRKNQKLAALAFAAAFLALGPALAAEPQPAKEIAAAAQHAGLAAQGTTLKEVQTHLHHTINCLVGPEGKGFAPKEMNPCAALGNGAIPDTADAAKKKALELALEEAHDGVTEDDLADAKKDAAKTQTMLDALK
ncbi:MAG: hypothetical protein K8R18_16650 [Parvibaculum sp.]|uniref:hypothetical protein n=1 Tax=Parvibaculum sp. TaxID=2024848 RepID=UPI0025E32B9D|nr:hypothetical protein [Parvibaculum sp.]MCE9651251.1 hypothetical protein [Parvibaculum sp.]